MINFSKTSLGSLIAFGAVISFGLIGSSYVASQAFKDIKLKGGSITVKGFAQKHIVSDFAKWNGQIETPVLTTVQAAYEKLELDRAKLLETLLAKGFNQEEVALLSPYLTTIYQLNEKGITTNQIEGYKIAQEFNVASSKTETVKQAAREITDLMKEGILIYPYQPQFFYTNLDQLKIAMLGEAAKDALNRADQLANNCKACVGSLKSAQQGVFQITPAYSTQLSDYGEYDTTSIDKSIKAVVTMEFSLS